jgi:hypothetical protein
MRMVEPPKVRTIAPPSRKAEFCVAKRDEFLTFLKMGDRFLLQREAAVFCENSQGAAL